LLEKITALVESLPKALRRNFVPVPDTAERCTRALSPCDRPLVEVLAKELERSTKVKVPPDAFRPEACPPHLSMLIRVVDASGAVVGASRDLDALQQTLGVRAKESFDLLPKSGFERERVGAWDFGDLPLSVDVPHGGFALRGYPALVAEGEHVALRVMSTESAAEAAHRSGLRRLYVLRLSDVVKSVRRNLPGIQGMSFLYALIGSGDDLKDDILRATVDRACIGDDAPVRTADAFEHAADRARGALAGVASELCGRVALILSAYHDATRALPPRTANDPYADIRDHLATLVYRGFVTATPAARLPHLPRYLKAVQLRIERIRQYPRKDRERALLLAPLVRQYEESAARLASAGGKNAELERYRWLLEEWRVSLFAQELKTAEPVSERRLAEQWQRALELSL
jgi:ATP-dependent helicase HrpA